ncbi:MAG: SAM-dependent methyltransferase [Streptococcaceae bacterium]|jgi:tRNA-Thr(GGU) m(6)t(6)A37 methyltransferase TsaA|nr:SAM-dependent methyltransferase [Streptococcaceae bacterium]
MIEMKLKPIGNISSVDGEIKLVLEKQYIPALSGLEGFSHLQILWWFSDCDNVIDRSQLTEASPYKNSPETLGIFATRSPRRPNPIALDSVQITYLDQENGEIGLTWLEAFDGTPVLDIKPYTPSIDRVMQLKVPEWCAHWPSSYEESGDFDWENELSC